MSLTSTIDRLEKLNLTATKYINGVGVFFLFVMMMVTVVDVTCRFLFNLPVTGSIEITGFLLLLTIFLGIPYASARGQHIRIDLLSAKFKGRRALVLESITLLVEIALFAVLVWQSIRYSVLMHTMNRVTAVLRLAESPFVLMVSFGSLIAGIGLTIKLMRNIAIAVQNWRQAMLWAAVGVAILFAIYSFATWVADLPWWLGPLATGIVGMLVLFIAFLSGLPIISSLILVGFLGMSYLRGAPAGLSIMGSSPFSTASHFTFSVIPLFVLMGEFCFFSGIGTDLYQMAYRWFGHFPGGLSMGTVVGCGGFAAVCGDSMATAVTMGAVALPEMKRFKYDPRLAVGCVAAGGTLGVLIPPSLAFILYALLTDQSIATLFIAGIIPGILLISLFLLTIYVMARRNPLLGPPGPTTTWPEKMASLKGVWATLVLFALVIGGMYAGVFTPTEGGGIGAFGALIIGIIRGRLKWHSIVSSLLEAGKISAVCISILIGANIFGYFLATSKLPFELAGYVAQLAVPALLILIIILVIYLFLGCLMPAIPMLILTVPIFYPVVTTLGYDPIWFGVLMVLMFEMAVITPPMGINVLALRAVATDVDLGVMFKGTMPFLIAMILCVAILIVLPDFALFLPELFGK
jgi:tripartite ATP-independent transporter DctM subunit